MSWLYNFLKCEIPCKWECCAESVNTKINRDHFWNLMHKMKGANYTFKPSNVFIFEKIIHLNDNHRHRLRTNFSIGLNPENEFIVSARLQTRRSGDAILIMDREQLNHFMEFLNDHEKDILLEWPEGNLDSKYNLSLHQIRGRILEICIHGRSIFIDDDSLKSLCRNRLHIQRVISSLDQQSKKNEILFFKLLSHYCYAKTVTEANDLTETGFIRYFFEELINFHCECLDKTFIMEITFHFEQWFAACVKYFISTLMLNESARLHTFLSGEWPHSGDYININHLAKSGFYYLGSSDKVQCAFCNLILHRWEADDNAVLEHCKYKPTCPFLRNHAATMNVSDIGKRSDLLDLLSVLTVAKHQRGIDEVDSI